MLHRRDLLAAIGFAAQMGGLGAVGRALAAADAGTAKTYTIVHSDAEWRALLAPDKYRVLREGATEPPFTSPLLTEHRVGLFTCAGCGQPVFSSTAKFDSNTGWPSFWQAVPDAVAIQADHKLAILRSEVHCTRCGSHLGHVFEDGPPPTGLRYCMNGVAFLFVPT